MILNAEVQREQRFLSEAMFAKSPMGETPDFNIQNVYLCSLCASALKIYKDQDSTAFIR